MTAQQSATLQAVAAAVVAVVLIWAKIDGWG